jgi:hypothetical protein
MNTTATTLSRPTSATDINVANKTSPIRRIVGVAARPQSYRNIGYLLLGLPLGTIWFTVVVTGAAVGISMLIVALLGIPILWAMWYACRAFGNVERTTASALLDLHLTPAPMASPYRGNLWVRLRSMSRERDRWRELVFLMLRFPAGIATFTVAVAALTTPVASRTPRSPCASGRAPFGEWSQSSRMEDIASGPWASPIPAAGVGVALSRPEVAGPACSCARSTMTNALVPRTS